MAKQRTLKVDVSAGCLILMAIGVLALPSAWLAGMILAAATHELGHLIAMRLLKIRLLEIRLTAGGAVIRTGPMGIKEELICAAAGPAASLLLCLGMRKFPELALSGMVQGLFNLLPREQSDGGRILRCAVIRFAKDRAQETVRHTEGIVWGLLLAAEIWACFRYPELRWYSFPVLALTAGSVFRKFSCKDDPLAVQ